MARKPTFEELERKIEILKQEGDRHRVAHAESRKLLRDVCHRTLNHFQIICAMITLKAASVENPEFILFLKKFENRVRSIALVHEELAKQDDSRYLNFKTYVSDLVAHLKSSYQVNPARIAFQVDVQEIALSMNRAVPCGLVINELISNVLEHAFPDERDGELSIAVQQSDSGEMEIRIGDNGIGMPEGFDLTKTETLGLQMVTNLAKIQLGGRIRLETDRGTEFQIRIKAGKDDRPAERGAG